MNTSEIAIFKKFITNKEDFDKYGGYFSKLPTFNKELKLLLNLISSYYDTYQSTSISTSELLTYFDYTYPNNSSRFSYAEIIKAIEQVEVNDELLINLIEQTVEKHYSNKIITELLPVIEGNKYSVLQNIPPIIDEYSSVLKNPNSKINQDLIPNELSVQELVTKELNNPGLQFSLKKLNSVLGGLRTGTNNLMSAYVGAGKTSFWTKQAATFAKQLNDGEHILYAGNEEAAYRVNLRTTQALLNLSYNQILQDPEKIEKDRMEAGFGKIKIFDSITGTNQIRKLLDKYHTKVLIVDQGPKVVLSDYKNKDTKSVDHLELLFNWYRELAKEYDIGIISIAQSGLSGYNKRWLNLTDIYGSNSAIQGEVDFSIGMGFLDDPAKETQRYFHITKAKPYFSSDVKSSATFIKENCSWKDNE